MHSAEHLPDDAGELPGIALAIPVPPNLPEACGYRGPARYVGLHWMPGGDEVVYDDGRRSGTGNSHVFLAYWRHPAVAPLLQPYNLGSSDQEADYALVVDRQRQQAAVALRAAARAFLKAQHSPEPPLTSEQTAAMRQHLDETLPTGWREVDIDPQAVREAVRRQRQVIQGMLAWLSEWDAPEHRERELTQVELGDIVTLHQAYPVRSRLYGQQGAVFSHGIVAEILSRLPDGRTRCVSLYLYSAESRHIYLGPNGIPEFVDHHCAEFTLYKRATEMGYLPTDPTAPADPDHA